MVLRGLPSCRTLGSPKSLRELVHTDFLSEPLHSASGSDLAFSSIVQPSILSNDGLYLLSSHQLMSEPPSDATSSASDLMLQTPMDHAVDLVERMLDVDPDSRVSATQALVHPFLTRSSTSQSMLAHVPAADSLLADVSLEIPVPVDMASGLPMGTMTVQNFVSHPGMYGPTGFPSSSVGMQSISRIASLSPG
jgi:serine/threonine protein kinase